MSKQDPAYYKRHRVVYKARGKAKDHACEHCGEPAAAWAQIHDTSGESADDYMPLCWKCHHKYDDRWNAEERAKVAASVKRVWESSPERKQAMSENPHRLRARR